MKNSLIALAVIASIGACLVAYNSGAIGPKGDTGAQGPKGEQGIAGRNGVDGKNGKDGKDAGTVLGAAGSVFSTAYITVNGVTQEYRRVALQTATTTVCAFKTPAATTTLKSASVYFRTSTSSAALVELAKSLTAFSTTTVLARETFAAGSVNVVLNATSTALDTYTAIIGPNQWIVAKMGSASGGTFSPAGTCQAVFEVVQ
ncbi:collagen-like protein [Bradyrhizobium sp. AUGA SZCCT0431]|uniref:collagen-like triple helix repeat-containing protein n=1 Tax=Bradyrhizobium sp. AUGA SZCCT0431 TaxID=2807674 RepID=UPI001BA6B153|nr:collagen-like protein [Bradyrhizobium sp. AUGA SZCCT0431]MBR1146681.1 collagen-like protein [Bradyrhizobium sp. AUGA SZCCT0431]